MEAHLQELLRAAEQREDPEFGELASGEQRVARSKGVSLSWNPAMGNKNVILHDEGSSIRK